MEGPPKNNTHTLGVFPQITWNESQRWQALAGKPEEEFEQYIASNWKLALGGVLGRGRQVDPALHLSEPLPPAGDLGP